MKNKEKQYDTTSRNEGSGHWQKKNPLHQQLNMLVGDWKLEASFLSFNNDPSATDTDLRYAKIK